MLITSVAALMMMAASAAPPRRITDCVAMPILMAWHDSASARRDPRSRDIRVDRGWRPRSRCFRLSAR